MAKFNPELRILWEGSTDNLNVQIREQIEAIESEAAEIRKAGDSPELALAEKVDALRAAIARGRFEISQLIDAEIEEHRTAWIADRDKNPERETAQLMRAQNEIGSLTDTEVLDLADRYEAGNDLTLPAINLIKTRLRRIDDSEGSDPLPQFASAVEERHGDAPWISENAEARALASYRADLNALEKGEVLYDGEHGRIAVDVGDLIDYQNELNEE